MGACHHALGGVQVRFGDAGEAPAAERCAFGHRDVGRAESAQYPYGRAACLDRQQSDDATPRGELLLYRGGQRGKERQVGDCDAATGNQNAKGLSQQAVLDW